MNRLRPKSPTRPRPARAGVRYVSRFAPGLSRLGPPGKFRYRYHEDWRAARDRSKFEHLLDFGRRLPAIRRRAERDLRGPPLARATVLAALTRLLESTLIRVGNEEYAKANHSYGLTTFRNRHVDVGRTTMRFHFRGKSGRWHEIERRDPRLAALLRRLQDLPGQDLFQSVGNDGRIHSITSGDVNDYPRVISAYLQGKLPVAFPADDSGSRRRIALSLAERALLRLLASK